MKDTQTGLNHLLASWTVLVQKLRQSHWLVKGPHFFTLHAKFEELYTESAEHVDELAERLLALGHVPVSTLAECLKLSAIKESTATGQSAEGMVEALLSDLKTLSEDIQVTIEVAEQGGDHVTADMLTGMLAALEKHAWMMRAFLDS